MISYLSCIIAYLFDNNVANTASL